MNIVEKYYMRKASMGNNDEYYIAIEDADIQILRKAQMYLLISPTVTVGIVYLLNRLRYEIFISQHFYHIIKRYQDAMASTYKRRGTKSGSSNAETKQSSPADIKEAY